ncbi:septal ring lytic transglycosylase RlpA family protein [Fundidesulfovibrio butyratiphilus]
MRQRITALVLVLFCLALAACSSKKPVVYTGKGTQRPYTIRGKTYYPLASAHGFAEEGVASWYGPDFHGKRTACGETYDMCEMTCAHKVLPMNTMLSVTNLENGRQVHVRVNDRGPFVSGRIVDLSRGAALALGMTGKGTARVRLATVGAIPGQKDGELPGPFYVQVGAFSMRSNADKTILHMLRKGYLESRIEEGSQTGQWLLRVQAGTFPTLAQAQAGLDRLRKDYPDAFVIAQ